jgi:hypothetical protein
MDLELGSTGGNNDDGAVMKVFGSCDGSQFLDYCDGFPETDLLTAEQLVAINLDRDNERLTSTVPCLKLVADLVATNPNVQDNSVMADYGLIAVVAKVCPSTAAVIGSALGYLGLFEFAASVIWIVLLTSTGLMNKKGESGTKFDILKDVLGDKAGDVAGKGGEIAGL